jgi:hypothetical protein
MVLEKDARPGLTNPPLKGRTMRHAGFLGLILAAAGFAALCAEEPAGPASPAADSAGQDESSLHQAAAVARRLEARSTDMDEIIPPIERPLLLFGDDPRDLTRGILWGWGKGRPVAIAELWRGRAENSPHAVSLTLTGPQPIVLTSDGTPKWKPEETQIAFAPVADAPPPAAKETGRLRQIKEISRRFTAHEFWDPDNSRFELRLLVQPVHRYSDSSAEIQDGAVFVLAHGTNPEAVLLIEAAGPTIAASKWQYGLVRTSNAETHALFDGKEVWMQPRVGRGATRPAHPYYVFSLPFEAPDPQQPTEKP